MFLPFGPFTTDFYKTGRAKQYPVGTKRVYQNHTCRSDKHANVLPDFDGKVVNVGLQAALCNIIELWEETFFYKSRAYITNKFKKMMDNALGPNAVDVDYMLALHSYGRLPLTIKSLPEGARVNMKVALNTTINCHDDFAWLPNYMETPMSAELWKTINNATIAFEFRRLLNKRAITTGVNPDMVKFQGHNFSCRGMSGTLDAAMCEVAHLASFCGTDTISGIEYIEEMYDWDWNDGILGCSVPATEHSVMCAGTQEDEIKTFERMLDLYPTGIISIVSDTWDLWKVLTVFMPALKEKIMARNGKVVIRPDSGDPVNIVCGDVKAEYGSPARSGAVKLLYEVFGGTPTKTGHLELNSHVGLIYGDAITLGRADAMTKRLSDNGFASTSCVLGIGSYTYQYSTRDAFGQAIKTTWVDVDSCGRDVFKCPVTDDGTKNSARGLIRVEKVGNDYVQYDQQTPEQESRGELKQVFYDGVLTQRTSFKEIRSRIEAELNQQELAV